MEHVQARNHVPIFLAVVLALHRRTPSVARYHSRSFCWRPYRALSTSALLMRAALLLHVHCVEDSMSLRSRLGETTQSSPSTHPPSSTPNLALGADLPPPPTQRSPGIPPSRPPWSAAYRR